MLQYRLFFFDALGRLTHAHEFEAPDDDQALRIAKAWQEGRSMELWCRDRRVRRWQADDLG
jgi:hypothetical protein